MSEVPSTASSVPAKKPLWRRIWRHTVRVVLVLIVMGIVLFAIASYWAARIIHDEVSRIRAAGEPLSFADLNGMIPKVNRDEDAGPIYAAGAILARNAPDMSEKLYQALHDGDHLPTPEMLEAAQVQVDKCRRALELLDDGAALPGCNATVELEEGMNAQLNQLGRYSALAGEASLRTRLLAFQGHGEAATKSAASGFLALRPLNRQPVLTDALVQLVWIRRYCNDVSVIMECGNPTDADLKALDAMLAKVKPIEPHQMFLTERVYAMELTGALLIDGSAPTPPPGSPEAPPLPERWNISSFNVTMRFFAADHLTLMGRFVKASSGDWLSTLASAQAIADDQGSLWTISGMVNRMEAPSFASSLINFAQGAATLNATRAALGIERYRLANGGRLPDALNQVPDAAGLPEDPMTHQALIYARTADGYCVYSAGYRAPANRDADPMEWVKKWGVHVKKVAS